MTKKSKEETEEQAWEAEAEQQGVQPQEETKPDYYESLLRLKAEFENYRKRTEREKPELIAFGAETVIQSFLPLYDAMLKAKQQIKKDASEKSLKDGLDMVFKEMTKVFEANGVKPMEVLGKLYNHEEQEVLTTLPCTSADTDGLVTEEVQKGFTINGKVLRHAKVCVGKFEKKEEEKQG